MSERHRPSEPFSPRPGDLLAERLRLLATVVRRTGVVVDVDGVPWDADALDRIVEAQAIAEAELNARFRAFQQFYAAYTPVLRERERVLHGAIAWFDARDLGPTVKASIRMCKLRRPPLAKVRSLVDATPRQRAAGE